MALHGIGTVLSDEDAELLTEMMADALPDRFREHDFVRFMTAAGAATLRKVHESELKRQKKVASQRRKQQQKRGAASRSATGEGSTAEAQQS